MTSPTLQFLGAAGTVTGSRFLVQSGDAQVMVDAGLYQGLAEVRRRNWEPFPIEPATIDSVVLTHAARASRVRSGAPRRPRTSR